MITESTIRYIKQALIDKAQVARDIGRDPSHDESVENYQYGRQDAFNEVLTLIERLEKE